MCDKSSKRNSISGPALSSTYIQCPSFENQPYHKACKGTEKKIWQIKDIPNIGQNKFAGCRKLCIDYAQIHGPGCCSVSETGKCVFVIKGKVVNTPERTNGKAVYCTTSYDAGKVPLNFLCCIFL